MTPQNKVTQDQRSSSRVIVRLDCRLEYNNASYDALIVDLSQRGALIMSSLQPLVGNTIKISLQSSHLKKKLTLTGSVLRCSKVMTEYGERGRFAVRFSEFPLELMLLIAKLNTA